MDLLIGTFVLRPYVFGFLAAFLAAGAVDLGVRRTLLFAAWVGPLAWLAEFTSTRIGIPFGLYHYTGTTRGQELFIADVPFMDCLSFTFLVYAAFCLARVALAGPRVPAPALALVSGVLMVPRSDLFLPRRRGLFRGAALEFRRLGGRRHARRRGIPDAGAPRRRDGGERASTVAGDRAILRRAWLQPGRHGVDR
jgi:hypothetical protein